MAQLHSAFTLFLSLLVEAMPFLLLGVVLSSGLLALAEDRQILARFPKNPLLGAVFGSFLGFLFPACECGNVPVARRLLLQGVPSSVAIAFLLAAPTLNPIVLWSTWIAFRQQPQIVVLRFVFSLIVAVTISAIFSVQKNTQPLLREQLAKRLSVKQRYEKPSAQWSGGGFSRTQTSLPLVSAVALNPQASVNQRLWIFLENAAQELRDLGAMLVLGCAIAAAIQSFVPRDLILGLGQGTLSSILVMLLLGMVVSICSTVDAFFALSFAAVFTPSSLLGFLVLGPIIDIKSLGLLLSVFRPRIVAYLLILSVQLVLLLCLIHSYFF
ncbi:MAG: permease [Cyanobacteria bacterium P01_H01_bin.15]